jgi:hypothetical protein
MDGFAQAQKGKMMNDLISRQVAIDAAEKESQVDGAYGYMDTKSIVDLLNNLPAAQRERKMGKWKGYNADNPKWQRTDGTPIFLVCSECNWSVLNNGSAHWNFCPNCGADMRKREGDNV